MSDKTVFNVLYDIDVHEFIKEKNGFDYLPWARAWKLVKENFPEATYVYHRFGEEQRLFNFIEGYGSEVMVSVTINEQTHTSILPILSLRNAPVLDFPASDEVNRAIQRCFTKAIGMHGLGLGLYEGEDVPDTDGFKRSGSSKKKSTKKSGGSSKKSGSSKKKSGGSKKKGGSSKKKATSTTEESGTTSKSTKKSGSSKKKSGSKKKSSKKSQSSDDESEKKSGSSKKKSGSSKKKSSGSTKKSSKKKSSGSSKKKSGGKKSKKKTTGSSKKKSGSSKKSVKKMSEKPSDAEETPPWDGDDGDDRDVVGYLQEAKTSAEVSKRLIELRKEADNPLQFMKTYMNVANEVIEGIED